MPETVEQETGTFESAQRKRCLALARRSAQISQHGYFVRQPNSLNSHNECKQQQKLQQTSPQETKTSSTIEKDADVPRPYLLIDAAKHCRIIARNRN